ncbi:MULTISPECIES: hypothetical protein [Desertifilum]|nr:MULTISPECIES: hypothetical protein [Desertifilum]
MKNKQQQCDPVFRVTPVRPQQQLSAWGISGHNARISDNIL